MWGSLGSGSVKTLTMDLGGLRIVSTTQSCRCGLQQRNDKSLSRYCCQTPLTVTPSVPMLRTTCTQTHTHTVCTHAFIWLWTILIQVYMNNLQPSPLRQFVPFLNKSKRSVAAVTHAGSRCSENCISKFVRSPISARRRIKNRGQGNRFPRFIAARICSTVGVEAGLFSCVFVVESSG